MKNIFRNLKISLIILIFLFLVGCGGDVTGIWLISGQGNAQMRLQQSGNQIVGLAYYQGQLQGQVYGQISGENIVLQVRGTYTGIVSYTGYISTDWGSMQLKRSDGQLISMFRSG